MHSIRIAAIPLRTVPKKPEINKRELERRLEEAMVFEPQMVFLPECTLTGYLYRENDLKEFAEPIPGPTSDYFSRLSRQYGIFLGAGILESTGEGFYDSAILTGPDGNILLHARKINEKPPFRTAKEPSISTIDGIRLGVLVCGDLFHEYAPGKMKEKNPHIIWVPLARSFPNRSPDPERWNSEEREIYRKQASKLNAYVVMVNALETGVQEPSFGGAMAVNPSGRILRESPHGTDEILIIDINTRF